MEDDAEVDKALLMRDLKGSLKSRVLCINQVANVLVATVCGISNRLIEVHIEDVNDEVFKVLLACQVEERVLVA